MIDAQDSDIVITPVRNKKEKEIPADGILFVNPTEAALEMGKMKKQRAESRFLFNSQLYLISEEKFIAGPSIGAPMAVLTMEKLIALGAKRIILFGWCGALARDLHIGDVLVPTLALSGEGTSQYYQMQGGQAGPSAGFRDSIASFLTDKKIEVHGGCVWSTDAIYREKRNMLDTLHRDQHVVAIDMEFSALCSVAKFRGIDFAAVLMVSDEIWGKSWRPGFSNKEFKNNAALIRQLLIDNQIDR